MVYVTTVLVLLTICCSPSGLPSQSEHNLLNAVHLTQRAYTAVTDSDRQLYCCFTFSPSAENTGQSGSGQLTPAKALSPFLHMQQKFLQSLHITKINQLPTYYNIYQSTYYMSLVLCVLLVCAWCSCVYTTDQPH